MDVILLGGDCFYILMLVEQRDIITVEPMDKVHALVLFEKKLGKQGDSKDNA
jgi:hypothetical protein